MPGFGLTVREVSGGVCALVGASIAVCASAPRLLGVVGAVCVLIGATIRSFFCTYSNPSHSNQYTPTASPKCRRRIMNVKRAAGTRTTAALEWHAIGGTADDAGSKFRCGPRLRVSSEGFDVLLRSLAQPRAQNKSGDQKARRKRSA
jgi:hypothetical protein